MGYIGSGTQTDQRMEIRIGWQRIIGDSLISNYNDQYPGGYKCAPKHNLMIEPDLGNNVNPAVKLECVPKWTSKNYQKAAAVSTVDLEILKKSSNCHFDWPFLLPDIRWTPSLAQEAANLWGG